MTLDGCRRFGAIEFERHDNHEKTIQLYPGTVRVREAFVLRSIEVYPWFNDLVTVLIFLIFCAFSRRCYNNNTTKKKGRAGPGASSNSDSEFDFAPRSGFPIDGWGLGARAML